MVIKLNDNDIVNRIVSELTPVKKSRPNVSKYVILKTITEVRSISVKYGTSFKMAVGIMRDCFEIARLYHPQGTDDVIEELITLAKEDKLD